MAAAELPFDVAAMIVDHLRERCDQDPANTLNGPPQWGLREVRDSYTTLASLRLVNRTWNELATPALFSYLAFDTNESIRADVFRQSHEQGFAKSVEALALTAEAFASRRTTKHDIMSFCRLLSRLPALKTLVISLPPHWYGFDDHSRMLFEHLLRQLLRLESLSVRYYHGLVHLRSGSRLLPDLVSHCQSTLRSFQARDSLLDYDTIKAVLACPHLMALALTLCDVEHSDRLQLRWQDIAANKIEDFQLVAADPAGKLREENLYNVLAPLVLRTSRTSLRRIKFSGLDVAAALARSLAPEEGDDSGRVFSNLRELAFFRKESTTLIFDDPERGPLADLEAPALAHLILGPDEVFWLRLVRQHPIQLGFRNLRRLTICFDTHRMDLDEMARSSGRARPSGVVEYFRHTAVQRIELGITNP